MEKNEYDFKHLRELYEKELNAENTSSEEEAKKESGDQGRFGEKKANLASENTSVAADQGSFGQKKSRTDEDTWTCPACETVNTGNFCSVCGEKRPETEKEKLERERREAEERERQARELREKEEREKQACKGKGKKPLIIGLCATVALTILLFVIHGVVQKKAESSNEGNSVDQSMSDQISPTSSAVLDTISTEQETKEFPIPLINYTFDNLRLSMSAIDNYTLDLVFAGGEYYSEQDTYWDLYLPLGANEYLRLYSLAPGGLAERLNNSGLLEDSVIYTSYASKEQTSGITISFFPDSGTDQEHYQITLSQSQEYSVFDLQGAVLCIVNNNLEYEDENTAFINWWDEGMIGYRALDNKTFLLDFVDRRENNNILGSCWGVVLDYGGTVYNPPSLGNDWVEVYVISDARKASLEVNAAYLNNSGRAIQNTSVETMKWNADWSWSDLQKDDAEFERFENTYCLRWELPSSVSITTADLCSMEVYFFKEDWKVYDGWPTGATTVHEYNRYSPGGSFSEPKIKLYLIDDNEATVDMRLEAWQDISLAVGQTVTIKAVPNSGEAVEWSIEHFEQSSITLEIDEANPNICRISCIGNQDVLISIAARTTDAMMGLHILPQ